MNAQDKAMSAIIGIAAVLMAVVFFLTLNSNEPRWELSQVEAERITKELHRRAADDCVLTPAANGNGYVCREFRTGRVFKIAAAGK